MSESDRQLCAFISGLSHESFSQLIGSKDIATLFSEHFKNCFDDSPCRARRRELEETLNASVKKQTAHLSDGERWKREFDVRELLYSLGCGKGAP